MKALWVGIVGALEGAISAVFVSGILISLLGWRLDSTLKIAAFVGVVLACAVLGAFIGRRVTHQRSTHLVSAVIMISALAVAADSSFFKYSTPVPLGEGGKWVTMKLEEVDRTDSTSIVEVSGAARSTDSSAVFLLSGMCGLARARGQRYFQARQIDSDPLTFEVMFLSSRCRRPCARSLPALASRYRI